LFHLHGRALPLEREVYLRMSLLSTFLLILAALVAIGWFGLLTRLLITNRGERPLEPILDPVPEDAPLVDVIVAARNEEREIERCVISLLAQSYPHYSITVVDDQSTDGTGAILDALAARPENRDQLRVIHGVKRPEGWMGKTWALQQAIGQARGEWLWFVDGDVWVERHALATAWHVATRRGADLVSILPGARCETFWQSVISPTLGIMLVQLYPVNHVNDPKRPNVALAAGGFLLIRRTAYEDAGGHAAVRGEVIEDIHLARLVKKRGWRLHTTGSVKLATTHMYGTLAEIWRGMRKNAFALMDYRLSTFAWSLVLWTVMAWTPVAALIAGIVARANHAPGGGVLVAAGIAGILGQFAISAPFVLLMKLPILYSLSLPLGISLYLAIISSSVWLHARGQIHWKGVTYASKDVKTAGLWDRGRGDGAAEAALVQPAPVAPESRSESR
jgi:cellulose synthase/poly-beta-1,6-N-acetylglucosamine synthase-like glycosyltransferase